MVMVLHRFDDVNDEGDLLPGYADENRIWCVKPENYTPDYINGAWFSAKRSGEAAFNRVRQQMGVTADGHIKDCCGGALVRVKSRSRKLICLMSDMEMIYPGVSGWNFEGYRCHDQSITAHENIAAAECEVLRAAFPETQFEAYCWID